MLGAWLAMLALVFQCLVIQPHVEAHYATVSVEASHFTPEVTRTRHETQSVCIIGQALATAGAFALSVSPARSLIDCNLIATAPANRVEPSQQARSHNWQSRAPPQAV